MPPIVKTAHGRASAGKFLADLSKVFADEYIRDGRLQAGRKILLVKTAIGGTCFARDEWDIGSPLLTRLYRMADHALCLNGENRIVALYRRQTIRDNIGRIKTDDRRNVSKMGFVMKKMFDTFIGATDKKCELYDHVPAPYIRKEFSVTKDAGNILYITALGFYRLFINGIEITKGKLAPYISNPNHFVYYDTYKIDDYIRVGKNAVGVILGNGFQNCMGGKPWGFDLAEWASSPKLALKIVNGDETVVSSDASFTCHSSHIVFDDIRCGEYIDMTKYIENWNNVGFDDSEWSSAIVSGCPKGEQVLCSAEPIGIEKVEYPVSMKVVDGGMVFDFGTNMSGVSKIKFKGKKGQTITVWHSEALLENGAFYNKNTCTPDFDRNLSQKDIFICSGEEDVFEPFFTFHGYRYAFVEGIYPYVAEKDFITRLVVHSNIKQRASFECSDVTINDLQKITVNSDKSNFMYYPIDCPQREKNGWTADAALSAEQMLYNFDCANSLSVWLANIRKAQRENGQVPGVVPTSGFGYDWGSGPAWDYVLIELPYQIYRFTGDKKVLSDSRNSIEKYVSYLKTKVNENGLIAFGLPDWCEAGKFSEGDASTPLEISDSLCVIDLLNKACFIFEKLSDGKNYRIAEKFKNEIINSFNSLYVDGYCVKVATQTAQAKAIDVGIFDDNEKAAEYLVKLIKRDGNHFKVGVIGGRVLFRVLAENGYADLAYSLIVNDTFPSYKYWLDHGATSLWEAFNEVYDGSVLRKDGGRTLSLNHHFFGDISAFFYKYILGIDVNPNGNAPDFIRIKKCKIARITEAHGHYENKNGGITVAWKRDEDGDIVFSVNTTGSIQYVIED